MQQIWSATGRRKRASAQVRIASPGTGTIQINQVDAQIKGNTRISLNHYNFSSLKTNVIFLFKQLVEVLLDKPTQSVLDVLVLFV